ncbi:MAG TPA: DUF2914 domain-containing protein [Vicinamibacterales bacterium]
MTTPADLQAIMDAAEQAAASNDFPLAARHLRDAAELQERTLGPAHPDLANTLNNLGVVCERIGQIDEAERAFRRAYAIATSEFHADHPFLATSRANLEEFCRLHGRSFEEPAESKDPAAGAGSQEPDPAYTVDPAYTAVRSSSALDRPKRGILRGAILVFVAVLLMLGLRWLALRPSNSAGPVDATPTRELPNPTPTADPAPAPEASPAPSPTPETPAPAPTTPPPVEPTPAPPSVAAIPPPTSSDSPTVVDARVCRSLTTSGAWECDPVNGAVGPGPIYFFTRIATTRATNVQHRWYFRDQLHQTVTLSIQPNSAGYRTYSRTTINPERAGEWRVELTTDDGRVLNEQRFTVR